MKSFLDLASPKLPFNIRNVGPKNICNAVSAALFAYKNEDLKEGKIGERKIFNMICTPILLMLYAALNWKLSFNEGSIRFLKILDEKYNFGLEKNIMVAIAIAENI